MQNPTLTQTTQTHSEAPGPREVLRALVAHPSAVNQILRLVENHPEYHAHATWAVQLLERYQPRSFNAIAELKRIAAGAPLVASAPSWAPSAPSEASAPSKPFELVVDSELARLAIGLGHSRPLLLWLVSRSVDQRGAGMVTRRQAFAGLRRAGVQVESKTLGRWVAAAQRAGFLVAAGQKLFLTSQAKLAARLGYAAAASNPALVETNVPGTAPVIVALEDAQLTVERFCGLMLAAWHAGRARARVQPISRKTLSVLWGVSAHILRQWEAAAGIVATAHYAVDNAVGSAGALVSGHAYPGVFRPDEPGKPYKVLPVERLSNSYAAPAGLRVKPSKYTPNIIRRALVRQLAASVDSMVADKAERFPHGSAAQLSPTGRRVFQGEQPAAVVKTVERHLRKHQTDDPSAPHFAHLGATSSGTLYSVQTDGHHVPLELITAKRLATLYRLPHRLDAQREAVVLAQLGGADAIRKGWGIA
jgi:hypothetical protein